MTTSETKWTPGPWRVALSPKRQTPCVLSETTWICGEIDNPNGPLLLAEVEANARLIAAAPALYEAAQAHRAWSYAEKHGLGSFDQRMALCSHAESLTLRAMAQADGESEPAYKGTVGMTIWPHVELTETDEASGRELVAQCLDHERAALSSARGGESV